MKKIEDLPEREQQALQFLMAMLKTATAAFTKFSPDPAPGAATPPAMVLTPSRAVFLLDLALKQMATDRLWPPSEVERMRELALSAVVLQGKPLRAMAEEVSRHKAVARKMAASYEALPWVAFSPRWAPHVKARYTPASYDEDGNLEPVRIDIRCEKCGAIYRRECRTGLVGQHIDRFAHTHHPECP